MNEVRRLAFKDLDEALIKILQDTLLYLRNIDSPVDPATQQTYDYYINRNHTHKEQEI